MEKIKAYKKQSKSKDDLPRFLGLTACALNGKVIPEKLSQTLNHLEIAIGAKVITSSAYLQVCFNYSP
uniref:Uncharacterized protein n=1 Tax=Panagrolaimus davidi TaxID=227884 RepID=A0A914QHW3_9BILA